MPRGYTYWNAHLDAQLIALYEDEELSPAMIARRMGQSVSSVRQRLTKLRKAGKVTVCRGRGGRPPA